MSYFNFDKDLGQLPQGLSSGERVSERNRIVACRFSEALRALGWKALSTGDVPAPTAASHVVVVGVVTYSIPDLGALDALAKRWRAGPPAIFVVDLGKFHTAQELIRVVPGIPAPIQTPFVAEYRNGVLSGSFEGAQAIEWCQGDHS